MSPAEAAGDAGTIDDPAAHPAGAAERPAAPGAPGPPGPSSAASGPEAPDSIEEYRLLQPLGRGAMGQVYLAEDLLLRRPVAVKLIAATQPSAAARERFFVEARAIARLSHPNVVSIYRVGEHRRRPYLISEFVRGRSLDRIDKPVPPEQALRIALGLCRGLLAAHRRGVLHRDIKPANAILAEDGEVKLLDFGLAKLKDAGPEAGPPAAPTTGPSAGPTAALASARAAQRDEPELPPGVEAAETLAASVEVAQAAPGPAASASPGALTAAGAIVGSPLYIAPEVWAGQPATERSDLYSLGVLLDELLCGEALRASVPLADLPRVVREGDAPPLLLRRPELPPRLCQIIDRCLLRDPAQRFPSADALLDALLSLGPGQAAPPLPEGNPYRGLRPFSDEHHGLFFGRQGEARQVLERLRAEPALIVAGDSGVGKSSLCRAGVLPLLPAAGLGRVRAWHVASLLPGPRPLAALAAALPPMLGLGEPALREDPERWGRLLLKRPQGTLIFVDQLEELLTLAPPGEARLFGEVLGALLLHGGERVRLLCTARSDFLGRLSALPGPFSDLPRALLLLGPLPERGVREAITLPALAKGFHFESEELVDALQRAAAPGGLPLLQFALSELWEARDEERRLLPAAALAAMGGVEGALARHGDALLLQLPEAQRQAARRLLLSLCTAEGTAARRAAGELVPAEGGAAALALEALVRGRLVVARTGPGGATYELAHDALLRAWGTLRDLVAQSAEGQAARLRLRQAAAEWRRLGEGPEALWRDRQLRDAAALPEGELAEGEAAFLRASRRQQRLRRGGALGAALALPLLILGPPFALRLRARGEEARRLAAHLGQARLALAEARALDGEVAAARAAAIELFRRGQREAGEARWAEALAQGARLRQRYREDVLLPVEKALAIDSRGAEARAMLADALYELALHLSQSERGAEAAEALGRLAVYDDDGSRRARWSAPAKLTLRTTPPAEVALSRYELDGQRRRVASPVEALRAPLLGRALPPGSYLLELRAEGRPPVRYPLLLRRGEELSLDLALPAAVPDGFAYVPAGRYLSGVGDEALRAMLSAPPLHEAETGAYLIARSETLWADWISYLLAQPEEERARRAPRVGSFGVAAGSLQLAMLPSGRYHLRFQVRQTPIAAAEGERVRYPARRERREQDWLRLPVSGITLEDARAYVAWLDRSGAVPGARLCTGAEWERGARGADGRDYPHGDRLLPGDANHDSTYGKDPASFGPDEVGSHPASRSPFGLDDMAGNVWEWTLSPEGPAGRGGSFYYGVNSARSAYREVIEPSLRDLNVGLRVCATPR